MEAALFVIDLLLMIVFLWGIFRAEGTDNPDASLGYFKYKDRISNDN